MSASPDIFLSYNRKDAEVARRFAEGFEAAGFDVWWDQALRSGEAYDKVTEAALRGAKAVVVLWSKRSVDSRWVRAEASIADEKGTLAPVKIEPCDLPVMFRLTQTADLCHWRGAADDKGWRAFLGDVRRMVGQEPSEATAPAPAPALGESNIANVAILPFTCRGGGEKLEFLAEDLTEEITRKLPRKGIFKVLAAGMVASWRGKAVDYRVLGRDLDVQYLAEGKLQQSGESIRLTLQLIDTSTGNMPWSKRFVRSRADLADAVEELAPDIAYELAEQILEAEMSRAMSKRALLSGWDHTLRAMAYSRRPATDGVRRGLEEARQALAVSPDIALAHAFCVWGLAVPVAGQGMDLDADLSQEIQSHIDRAIQLDGDNPEVLRWLLSGYAALGECETNLRLAKHLVDTQPNAPNSWFWYGVANNALGRISEAIAALQKYDTMAKVDHLRSTALSLLSLCFLIEGRLAEAEHTVDRALALHPDSFMALRIKAIIEAHLGEESEALATVRRLRKLEPSLTIDNHARALGLTPQMAELTTEAVATLRRLWDETGSDG